MGFLGGKRINEIIIDYLKKEKVTYTIDGNIISFELYFSNSCFSLYPYIKGSLEKSDTITICINLDKKNEINIELLKSINNFNAHSPFFKILINDNILYLEYNVYVDSDTCEKAIALALSSLNMVEEEIDKL